MNENLSSSTNPKVGVGVGFERIRRITGYIGIIDRWNDAKKAEERERLKHSTKLTR